MQKTIKILIYVGGLSLMGISAHTTEAVNVCSVREEVLTLAHY